MAHVKAHSMGICAACANRFFEDDPIVLGMVRPASGVGEIRTIAYHSTCCGYTKDGNVSGDYIAAGRDPDLPRHNQLAKSPAS